MWGQTCQLPRGWKYSLPAWHGRQPGNQGFPSTVGEGRPLFKTPFRPGGLTSTMEKVGFVGNFAGVDWFDKTSSLPLDLPLPFFSLFQWFTVTHRLEEPTPTSLQQVDLQRVIILLNSTPLLHPQQRRLSLMIQSRNRSATTLWSSCRKSLSLCLRHQLHLFILKFSPRISKLPTTCPHPSRRR